MKFQKPMFNLNKLVHKNEDNKNILSKKILPEQKFIDKSTNWSSDKIIYDSDWITTEVLSGTLIDFDINKYSYILSNISPSVSSAIKNAEYPINVNFGCRPIISIPEEYLPFINVDVLTKTSPLVKFHGISLIQGQNWNTTNYYNILGDTQLIYKGQSPASRFFPESEITEGNILSPLTSKWLLGTIYFSIDSDNYELRSGRLVSVRAYYDVVPLTGHPGYYSYKSFETRAIDTLSSSSVTGTGTLLTITASEDEFGNPQTSTVTEKNVTQSTSLFGDFVQILASGTLYKNDVYQQQYTIDFPRTINHDGEVSSLSGQSIISYDYEDVGVYKLFFSDKRAREFRFNVSLNTITVYPTTSDYQNGLLPYSQLSVEVNPAGYPLEKDYDWFSVSDNNPSFVKINNNKFRLILNGVLHYSAPAIQELFQNFTYIYETYSPSGSTYLYDGVNRPGKQKSVWIAPFYPIEIKIIVSLKTNLNHDTSYQIK